MSSENASNFASEKPAMTGLAGRYAVALFELALEAKALDNVAKELATLVEMLDESSDLSALIMNPVISSDNKVKVLTALLNEVKASQLILNFVAVVAKNSRLDKIKSIITEFNRLLSHHKGEVNATVLAAHKLTKAQEKALKDKLKSVVGRDVNMTTDVDESLLGGMVVKIGSRMIDNSLKTRLANLEESMKEVG